MVSLLTAARLFVACFIAFIGVFCVVFWEDHRHEWVLYGLMLLASISAVLFFRYLNDIESPEVRIKYSWNARHLFYALSLSGFLGSLFGVYWTASIIQVADIDVLDAVSQFSTPIIVGAILLGVLWMASLALALVMYQMHWSVIEHHNCVTEQHRASAGCVNLADGLWMFPSNVSPYQAEEITVIAAANLLHSESRPMVITTK